MRVLLTLEFAERMGYVTRRRSVLPSEIRQVEDLGPYPHGRPLRKAQTRVLLADGEWYDCLESIDDIHGQVVGDG